jgi:hypothetical protein
MSDLGGFKVCGKRGGASFSNVKRGNLDDKGLSLCETGFVPCNAKASNDTKLCVE